MSIGSREYNMDDMPIPFKKWKAGEGDKCDWCGQPTEWFYQIPDSAPTGESDSVCEDCVRNGPPSRGSGGDETDLIPGRDF